MIAPVGLELAAVIVWVARLPPLAVLNLPPLAVAPVPLLANLPRLSREYLRATKKPSQRVLTELSAVLRRCYGFLMVFAGRGGLTTFRTPSVRGFRSTKNIALIDGALTGDAKP